jgi:hypothetical protein
MMRWVPVSRPKRFGLCQFESALVAWSFVVTFQRKKAAAIGVKAPFPGFAGAEAATSPRLAFVLYKKYEKSRIC